MLFFCVYRPNIVIGIVLIVHQPLKPPLHQTLEAYPGLTRPVLDTPPSYQILENTLCNKTHQNSFVLFSYPCFFLPTEQIAHCHRTDVDRNDDIC